MSLVIRRIINGLYCFIRSYSWLCTHYYTFQVWTASGHVWAFVSLWIEQFKVRPVLFCLRSLWCVNQSRTFCPGASSGTRRINRERHVKWTRLKLLCFLCSTTPDKSYIAHMIFLYAYLHEILICHIWEPHFPFPGVLLLQLPVSLYWWALWVWSERSSVERQSKYRKQREGDGK